MEPAATKEATPGNPRRWADILTEAETLAEEDNCYWVRVPLLVDS